MCRQGGADLLNKKTVSSGQAAATEVETVVDKDYSLDLNPNPTYPRGSDESMESDDSSEKVFDSESTQVNDHNRPMCHQTNMRVWWKPPMRWYRPPSVIPVFFSKISKKGTIPSCLKFAPLVYTNM